MVALQMLEMIEMKIEWASNIIHGPEYSVEFEKGKDDDVNYLPEARYVDLELANIGSEHRDPGLIPVYPQPV